MFLPILGGFLLARYGYEVLFLFGIFLLVLIAIKSLKIKTDDFGLDWKNALRMTRRTNLLVFIEGVGTTVDLITIMAPSWILFMTSCQ